MRIAQITDTHMTAGPPEPGGYDAAAALGGGARRRWSGCGPTWCC